MLAALGHFLDEVAYGFDFLRGRLIFPDKGLGRELADLADVFAMVDIFRDARSPRRGFDRLDARRPLLHGVVDFPFDLSDIEGLQRSIMYSHCIHSSGNFLVTKKLAALPPAQGSPGQCPGFGDTVPPGNSRFPMRLQGYEPNRLSPDLPVALARSAPRGHPKQIPHTR